MLDLFGPLIESPWRLIQVDRSFVDVSDTLLERPLVWFTTGCTT
jgi:hypothetical protein